MIKGEILKEVLSMPDVGRKTLMKLFKIPESDARAYAAIRKNQGVIREIMTDGEIIKSNHSFFLDCINLRR